MGQSRCSHAHRRTTASVRTRPSSVRSHPTVERAETRIVSCLRVPTGKQIESDLSIPIKAVTFRSELSSALRRIAIIKFVTLGFHRQNVFKVAVNFQSISSGDHRQMHPKDAPHLAQGVQKLP